MEIILRRVTPSHKSNCNFCLKLKTKNLIFNNIQIQKSFSFILQFAHQKYSVKEFCLMKRIKAKVVWPRFDRGKFFRLSEMKKNSSYSFASPCLFCNFSGIYPERSRRVKNSKSLIIFNVHACFATFLEFILSEVEGVRKVER